jgi:predicted nucleic acid-binding protein
MLNTRETVGVCPVVVAECYSGARPPERHGWAEIFGSLAFWPIEFTDAAQAGTWRYDFARRGIQLSTTDLLIAAVALRIQATLVTSNTRHFPMAGIQVIEVR